MLPGINLRQEQERLVKQLVEAEQSQSRRSPFITLRAMDVEDTMILHPGLPGNFTAYEGDLVALERFELIASRPSDSVFDITQTGLDYYEENKLADVDSD